eukprot:gnl/Dysnectes_brevis/2197_a2559_1494.p1 GENE.gnl/Dysnectes_brevis/2197_a2559_1494~~gnl/Dysnectes_brevis/2197_a2559_1494.p1  ORF type:complete len:269 (+),score=17.75 gnl/Dysnectes_brevis/2197_a2559_1494:133-939(+)
MQKYLKSQGLELALSILNPEEKISMPPGRLSALSSFLERLTYIINPTESSVKSEFLSVSILSEDGITIPVKSPMVPQAILEASQFSLAHEEHADTLPQLELKKDIFYARTSIPKGTVICVLWGPIVNERKKLLYTGAYKLLPATERDGKGNCKGYSTVLPLGLGKVLLSTRDPEQAANLTVATCILHVRGLSELKWVQYCLEAVADILPGERLNVRSSVPSAVFTVELSAPAKKGGRGVPVRKSASARVAHTGSGRGVGDDGAEPEAK